MKTRRQARILELIREKDVETQTDLLELLKADGFHVTQATVSRDIKEMRLIKVQDSTGAYRYAAEAVSNEEQQAHAYLFSTAVLSVDHARNLVVVKTQTGMAQAVCAALDATERPGVMGSIAGDDTIFIAACTDAAAVKLAGELKRLMTDKTNSFLT